MKKFDYIITDPAGIHARPAGMLAKAASVYKSSITIERDAKVANVKRILELMALGVERDEKVSFTIEGADEDLAVEELDTLCKENL